MGWEVADGDGRKSGEQRWGRREVRKGCVGSSFCRGCAARVSFNPKFFLLRPGLGGSVEPGSTEHRVQFRGPKLQPCHKSETNNKHNPLDNISNTEAGTLSSIPKDGDQFTITLQNPMRSRARKPRHTVSQLFRRSAARMVCRSGGYAY